MEKHGADPPVDLTTLALSMFDELVSRGKLLFAETTPEITRHDGFLFEFRLSPVLTKKPILPRNAKERSGNGGPFLNPDPDFVVSAIGHHHILELNMYSMFRPMFVLHTREFVPQTDDLDAEDIGAARTTMASLQQTAGPQMMLYNCGVDAGASQGHKHMQIVPLPSSFKLYPELATSTEDIACSIPNVPYKHFVLRVRPSDSPIKVYAKLASLVESCRQAQRQTGSGDAYNVIMTDTWVCVIPRRRATSGSPIANGAGMMGAVWLRDEHERQMWNALGPSVHLSQLGIPISEQDLDLGRGVEYKA